MPQRCHGRCRGCHRRLRRPSPRIRLALPRVLRVAPIVPPRPTPLAAAFVDDPLDQRSMKLQRIVWEFFDRIAAATRIMPPGAAAVNARREMDCLEILV